MFKVHVFFARWAELGKTMLEGDFGPFQDRHFAETCLVEVSRREDVYSAELRPVANEDNMLFEVTSGSWKVETTENEE